MLDTAGKVSKSEVARIENPVLRGFNPDPSILRIGEDFFIATSTFEWFPGVQIHHSRDLVHWRLLSRPLDRLCQLDLRGVPDSGGVWAPCLSWSDGKFYLVYSIVYELNSRMKDVRNFLVTADDIEGAWSDRVELNGTGFDPSLFHAADGRKWLLNMVWDHRPSQSPFYGISLQELDLRSGGLVGQPRIIFKGTSLGYTEGPHLYQRDGFYYLITAEGGTSWDHAVTVARSSQLEGPYETSPYNPLLTSSGDSTASLQKAGHGDLVETADGQWFLAHLCSRPIPGLKRCPLGRETALQAIEWSADGWPRLRGGGVTPYVSIAGPGLPACPWESAPERDEFSSPVFRPEYQTPREPRDERWASLATRPGTLRIRGGQSLASRFDQHLIAARVEAPQTVCQTALEFQPEGFQQMAGLVCYYSSKLWHYACISHEEGVGRCLYLQSSDCGEITFPLAPGVLPVPAEGALHLRAVIDFENLQFFYSMDEVAWRPIGDALDMSVLSDDYGQDWGFTGSFVGMACQDLTGAALHADFLYFERRIGGVDPTSGRTNEAPSY